MDDGVSNVKPGAPVVLWVVAVVLAAGFVAWIALTPLPTHTRSEHPWITVQASGYRVELPTAPTVQTVAFGAGHVVTSVQGPDAFSVVWFPAAGTDPSGVLARAVQALTSAPAQITRALPSHTGPFGSTEVTARLSAVYLHGRMLVVGRRVYLVAELTPGEATPPELDRLLGGFDPDPTAA